jgi:3-hydroxyacyl-[acyl-carrier-protein] dehydratase
MSLKNDKPYALLPHAFPFVLIDEVFDIDAGKSGKGKKLIPVDDSLGRGDVFPQAFLIEAAAQLSGIVSGREEGGYLAAVRGITFEKEVVPGDVVEFSSGTKGVFGGLYGFHVSAQCEGDLVMKGDIYLALA